MSDIEIRLQALQRKLQELEIINEQFTQQIERMLTVIEEMTETYYGKSED